MTRWLEESGVVVFEMATRGEGPIARRLDAKAIEIAGRRDPAGMPTPTPTPSPTPPNPLPPSALNRSSRPLRDLSDTRPSLLMQLRRVSAGREETGGAGHGAAPAQAGRTGDQAWQRFFEMYSPPVYRIAVRRGLSEVDAEDVVQQVMMAVLGHIGTFEYETSRGRFRHWVLRIAERKIADAFRKRTTREGKTTRSMSAQDGLAAKDGGPGTREGEWSEQWRLQDLNFCLDEVAAEIAPRRMEAFRMYVLQGVPAATVAIAMGMTVGHVYVTRSQVLKLIRRKLERLALRRGEIDRRDDSTTEMERPDGTDGDGGTGDDA